MRLLLDTHIWLWLRTEPARVPSPVKRKLKADSAKLYLSAVCTMEMAIKQAIGRLRLDVTLSDFIDELTLKGAVPIAITHQHAMIVAGLPLHHRDPFDRALIAQAKLDDLTLVTADAGILNYDVPTIDART